MQKLIHPPACLDHGLHVLKPRSFPFPMPIQWYHSFSGAFITMKHAIRAERTTYGKVVEVKEKDSFQQRTPQIVII
jgi:hypothetical protein